MDESPDATPVAPNPVNVLVGAWLNHRRAIEGLTTDQVVDLLPERRTAGRKKKAEADLGLENEKSSPKQAEKPTANFLRGLYSGANPLPPDYAVAVAKISGISFANAAQIVAIVRFLQLDARHELPQLSGRISAIRSEAPAFAPILNWIERSARKLANAKPNELSDEVDKVRKDARQRSSLEMLDVVVAQETSSVQTRSDARSPLSPIIDDLVQEFTRKLSLFPPHLNYASISEWEQINANRISAVWGFISQPVNVGPAVATGLDWTFMFNALTPRWEMIIPTTMKNDLARIEEDFRVGVLAKIGARLPKDVQRAAFFERTRIVAAKADIDVSSLLTFDFRTRRLSIDEEENDRKALIEQGLAREFKNVWLYELYNSGRSRSYVGILDSFDYSEPSREFFSVALSDDDVRIWRNTIGMNGV